MLLVTMPNTPFPHTPLNVTSEEKAIKAIFSGEFLTSLEHPNSKTVLSEIPGNSFVHFACHGISIPNDPPQSGLLLVESGETDMLILSEIEKLKLEGAEVAYLSACSTAQLANGKFVDEAIHLGNAFQVLGFPHVIGTIWGADDEAAGEIARGFYGRLFRQPETTHKRLEVAQALHDSILELRSRDDQMSNISKWGPFIHIGI